MSALTEAQQATTLDAKVELWTLDGTALGVGILRWTSGTADDQPVVFDGNTYPPTPIEADGFEWS
ncbi:MAG: phage minor tail protein L, partial [Pseudomonadota bacterium]